MRDVPAAIGQFAHMTRRATESDHFDAFGGVITRPSHGHPHRHSVRIRAALGVRQEPEPLHALQKRPPGLDAFQVGQQRVRHQFAALREMIILDPLRARPAICRVSYSRVGRDGRRWLRLPGATGQQNEADSSEAHAW